MLLNKGISPKSTKMRLRETLGTTTPTSWDVLESKASLYKASDFLVELDNPYSPSIQLSQKLLIQTGSFFCLGCFLFCRVGSLCLEKTRTRHLFVSSCYSNYNYCKKENVTYWFQKVFGKDELLKYLEWSSWMGSYNLIAWWKWAVNYTLFIGVKEDENAKFSNFETLASLSFSLP